jgi:hypothetical protein
MVPRWFRKTTKKPIYFFRFNLQLLYREKQNMEYSKIIAVSGLPGLYELINSKTDGAIVRSLEDKTTRFVSSRVHNFSHLESIEVYTVKDNVNLVEVLKAMEESSEKLPDDKDGEALKKYFSKVYKDLDFDRVYSSDLKKMAKWFVVLKKNKIPFELTQAAPEEVQAPAPAPTPPAVEEPKVTKAAPKPTVEQAPSKKTAKKKPAEAKETKEIKKETKKEPAQKKKPVAKKAAEKKPGDKKKAK